MSTIARWVGRARSRVVEHAGDLLVVVLIVTAVLERVVQHHRPSAAAVAAIWGLPLLARHRHPLLAPCATLLLIGASGILLPEGVGRGTAMEFLLTLAAVWMLAARNPPRRAAWALGPVVLAIAASAIGPEDLAFTGVLVLGAVVAGIVQRRASAQTVALHDRAAALEEGRESALREAAAAERARIARELHDIVAHSVGVMTVQAGAARMQLALDPPQASASVAAVEEATATALADLDRLLDLLGEQTGALRGLDDVDVLIRQVGAAGLAVTVHRKGASRPLPGGLDLALYRILQEALTNALKHAEAGRADVHLAYGDDEVALRVTSPLPPGRGATTPEPGGRPAGHGLIGMRERAELYGGQVDTGLRDGAFVVDVRVPTP